MRACRNRCALYESYDYAHQEPLVSDVYVQSYGSDGKTPTSDISNHEEGPAEVHSTNHTVPPPVPADHVISAPLPNTMPPNYPDSQ